MKSKRLTGLVGAGGVGLSFISRLPTLLRAIGPVKASSLRVARRLANTLRTGRPVEDYVQLKDCALIWVAVPETALNRVLHDLAAERWIGGKMVVLCGSKRDSAWHHSLLVSGALPASLNAIAPDETILAAEGDPAVLRELWRLVAAEKRKLIELRPASKPLYLAGLQMASNLLLPSIAGAIEGLRAAGFSRAEATHVAEKLGARSLRAYGKAGRKAWNRLTATDLRHSLQSDLPTIRELDPRVAALYSAGIEQALQYFDEHQVATSQNG